MEMSFILGVIGPIQVGLFLAVIILFYGGKKIPGLVKGVLQGIKDFKKEVKDDIETKSKLEKE